MLLDPNELCTKKEGTGGEDTTSIGNEEKIGLLLLLLVIAGNGCVCACSLAVRFLVLGFYCHQFGSH